MISSASQGEQRGILTALSALARAGDTIFDLRTTCWNGRDQIQPFKVVNSCQKSVDSLSYD